MCPPGDLNLSGLKGRLSYDAWYYTTNHEGREKTSDFHVSICMNYGVASFLSLSKSICNSKHALRELEGPLKLLLLSYKGEVLERA